MTRVASSASLRDDFQCKISCDLTLSVVVLGASGDLAKKKTFPALYALYSKKYATVTCNACRLFGCVTGPAGTVVSRGRLPVTALFYELLLVGTMSPSDRWCRCTMWATALTVAACRRFLPQSLQIIGYARTGMSAAELRDKIRPFLKGDAETVQKFLELITYVHGQVLPRHCYLHFVNRTIILCPGVRCIVGMNMHAMVRIP